MKRGLLRDGHGSTGTVYSNSGDAALSAPQNISGGHEKNCSRTTGTVGEDQSSQQIEGLNLSARMHLRRYARRTDAHIRKLANHKEAGELFGLRGITSARVNSAIRCTPVMQAGLATTIWTMRDLLGM